MNCQVSQNSLSAFLDRELSGEAMLAVRAHLEVCPACREEFAALRALKSELGTMPVIEPREGMVLDVMNNVRGVAAPAPRMPMGVMVATSVAAAVLALLAFNAFLGNSSTSQYTEDSGQFDAATDGAVTAPDFGGHAPLIPIGR